jgi:hypothetical protein
MKEVNINFILGMLPPDDITEKHQQLADTGLNLLVEVSIKLFGGNIQLKQKKEYQKTMEDVKGYEKLLKLHSKYQNINRKEKISIILGRFCSFLKIQPEYETIITTLNLGLTNPLTTTNKLHIDHIICSLISLSLDTENEEILIDCGVIPNIIPLIKNEDSEIWKDSIILVSNISFVNSIEKKLKIINTGLFDVFYEKMLQISPQPPALISFDNFYSLSRICLCVYRLVSNKNFTGVDSFLKTPLIRCLLWTLRSVSSVAITPSCTDNVVKLQKWICSCFLKCVKSSFEHCHLFINFGVIDELFELVEIHIREAKQKRKGMNQFVVKTSLNVLSNITLQGFKTAESNNKNVFCDVFNSIKGVERMVKIFDFFSSFK